MDIRLIAMDLDGTALQSDRCTFSPRLHKALEAAHAQGITVAVITGRQYKLLPPVLQGSYDWWNLAVLCNGGQIRDVKTGKLLHSLTIAPEALARLLELAEKYSLPIEFSVDSTLYLTEDAYRAQLPWKELTFHRDTILKHHGCTVPSLAPFCHRDVEKVNLLCITEEIRDALEQDLQSVAVSAVWSSSSSMEITHPDATKGNALTALCHLLDIPEEAAMALGDSGNDLTMLRRAGLGVAMGNAPDFVKAAADATTEANTADGAAIAIETYALK